MRFLLDQNVPNSVAVFLRGRGHEVYLVREVLLPDPPDVLIATVSEEKGWILVSADHDFDVIAARIPRGERARFRRLSRISLKCSEHQAAQRLEEFFDYIEIEYKRSLARPDRRILIAIQNSGFKINR